MSKKNCPGYWGIECEDGTCPLENKEEYIKCNKTPIKNCEECPYNMGCDSCIEEYCSERRE